MSTPGPCAPLVPTFLLLRKPLPLHLLLHEWNVYNLQGDSINHHQRNHQHHVGNPLQHTTSPHLKHAQSRAPWGISGPPYNMGVAVGICQYM